MTTSDNAAAVTATRDATRDDSRTLQRVHYTLTLRSKALKSATRAVSAGWVDGDVDGLRLKREDAQLAFDGAMDEGWAALAALPNGTVAPGGATPQTVGLEFFNRNLNRNLKGRITATEAKRINRISFG